MTYSFLTPALDAMVVWNQASGIDQSAEVPPPLQDASICDDSCHFCLGPETD
jgi:hypothetical protein